MHWLALSSLIIHFIKLRCLCIHFCRLFIVILFLEEYCAVLSHICSCWWSSTEWIQIYCLTCIFNIFHWVTILNTISSFSKMRSCINFIFLTFDAFFITKDGIMKILTKFEAICGLKIEILSFISSILFTFHPITKPWSLIRFLSPRIQFLTFSTEISTLHF